MRPLISSTLFALAFARIAAAQFAPAFLQNASYWVRDKSEFDFYDAEFMRDGQKHSCEMLMIFTPKFVVANNLTEVDDPKQPGAVPVIEMNETANLPRGLVAEQISLRALWRMDFMSLARLSFAGTDGIGQITSRLWELRTNDKTSWQFVADSYREHGDPTEIKPPAGTALFYDELPLRIRTIDFSKPNGEADVQVFPTVVTANKPAGEFKAEKLTWKSNDREIAVELTHDGGKDRFVLDRDFPFLLREWQMADGSRLKMKNSLRVNYRNYLKNGDREKALKDPMLRHPD